METRARYLTIGLFTLGVIAAGFLFVFWLFNSGGLGRRDHYNVFFKGPVSGLFVGAPVTFNGVKSGEVNSIGIYVADPRQVLVGIGVAAGTPVRADTKVALEFQGLTGTAAVALVGGDPAAAPLEPNHPGGIAYLVADARASQSMTQSARDALQKLDVLLADNADPLSSTISNLKTFTDALSRNSDRVDGILAGLERMTGGAAKKGPGVVVDLTAPKNFKLLAKAASGQMVIPEPSTTGKLDTDKLVLDPSAPADAAGGQWADVLPKLLQSRFVQSFENAGLVGSVIRGNETTAADYQLQTDVRSFRIVGAPGLSAEFELSAKVLNDKGRILAGRIFKRSVTLSANDPKVAASGLDEAFGRASVDLVDWATEVLAAQPPKTADPPPAQ